MEERFYKFSSFSCFPEIVQGISNRAYGEMKLGHRPNEEVVKNRRQFAGDLGVDPEKIVLPQQIHGSSVVVVDLQSQIGIVKAENRQIQADGLITSSKNVFLAVTIADCLPVFVYDPSKKVVALVHAGWRGIIDQIIPKTITKFLEFGSDPENLIIGIGPGICQKHFVVRNGVLGLFLNQYPSATFVRNKDGYVDLKKAVVTDLKKTKVHQNNIEIAPFCTVCDNGVYGSYRQDGEKGPKMMAVVGIKK